MNEEVGLICVSRPTNPTGNVITDDELMQLDALAQQHDVPLLIDNAYGVPFPGIIFSEVRPLWNPNIILCMSLSKLGLPGARCGIIDGCAATPVPVPGRRSVPAPSARRALSAADKAIRW